MGLAEGQTVRKLSRIRWGGPIVLLVNRAQVAVGRGMARKIVIRVKDGGAANDG
jgi:ferrous iron transport protein A